MTTHTVGQVNTWVKLLTPAKALDRVRGELLASDELPGGDVFHTHPLHQLLVTGLQFEEALQKRAEMVLTSTLGSCVAWCGQSPIGGFPTGLCRAELDQGQTFKFRAEPSPTAESAHPPWARLDFKRWPSSYGCECC